MRTVAPYEAGITVSDLERVLPFYLELLKFRVLSDIQAKPEVSRRTGLAAGGYRIVRLESIDGDRIKLVRPDAAPLPAEPPAVAMGRRGLSYVTFLVADLAGLHARLAAAGVPIRSEGIIEARPGMRLLLASDPEGNFVELVEFNDITTYRPPPGR